MSPQLDDSHLSGVYLTGPGLSRRWSHQAARFGSGFFWALHASLAAHRQAVRVLLGLAVLAALFACAPATAPGKAGGDEKVLSVAPVSDLENLDPMSSSSYIIRDHGYMIYDTLFGMDANGKLQPQMVDTYEQSADKKTWTFTLRDGLEFHDGKPVTSDDVIASIKRWGKKDPMGQTLMSFASWEVVNAKTFRLTLSAPYGLVLESLGHPDSYVPFIMPKRVADTPISTSIDDTTGSGPFIYKKDESRKGEKVVYVRNTKYKPRLEPASGTAGGKIAKVDRVEWIIIKDPQTQANALAAGEIDVIESPANELYPLLQKNPGIQMVETNPLGYQFYLRFNHLQPPFDNSKVRQAAMAALNQSAFLETQVGIPGMYRTCFSVYPCKTPYATSAGMDFIARPDIKRAQQLLKESGYDGKTVILLQQTDLAVVAKLPQVAKQLLTQAGFRVDMQAMDFQTLSVRRAKKDGWNIFITRSTALASMNPISQAALSAACDKAWFGWPCDSELEKLRGAFEFSGTEQERKSLAEQIQVRAMKIGTHVPLGEYMVNVAARKNVTGFVTGFFTVYWNVEKQ